MLPSGKVKDPEISSDDEDVETCLRYIQWDTENSGRGSRPLNSSYKARNA